jgi:hypothetical protein
MKNGINMLGQLMKPLSLAAAMTRVGTSKNNRIGSLRFHLTWPRFFKPILLLLVKVTPYPRAAFNWDWCADVSLEFSQQPQNGHNHVHVCKM